MPAFVVLKACFRNTEKKIPKRVGPSTQPCLTPLRMLNASDMFPSNRTVPCMLLRKESMQKAQKLGWAADKKQDIEEAISANQIKSLN